MPISIVGAVQQKKISIGKQVTITGSHSDIIYRARIEEIRRQTLLLKVTAPSPQPLQDLRSEAAVTISFVVPDDAIYSFAATISSCSEETALLQVQQSAPIKRTEQRSDYRLKTAKIIYLREETEEPLQSPNWQQACLLDLSRGGASIITTVTLVEDEIINIWIPLDEVDHVLETEAQVVRVKQAEEGQLTVGVRFAELSLLDQERILEYILKVWTEKKDAESVDL